MRCFGVYLDEASIARIERLAARLGIAPKLARSPVVRLALEALDREPPAARSGTEAPGERLRRLRLAAGFPRPTDLARVLGVHRATIEHAESGRNPIVPDGPLDRFARWAEFPCSCAHGFCVKHYGGNDRG